MYVKCVLEVGDTIKDKSDSIRFFALCQSWNNGWSYCHIVPPGYAYDTFATFYCVHVTRRLIAGPIYVKKSFPSHKVHTGAAELRFLSPQSDTSLHRHTTDTGQCIGRCACSCPSFRWSSYRAYPRRDGQAE